MEKIFQIVDLKDKIHEIILTSNEQEKILYLLCKEGIISNYVPIDFSHIININSVDNNKLRGKWSNEKPPA